MQNDGKEAMTAKRLFKVWIFKTLQYSRTNLWSPTTSFCDSLSTISKQLLLNKMTTILKFTDMFRQKPQPSTVCCNIFLLSRLFGNIQAVIMKWLVWKVPFRILVKIKLLNMTIANHGKGWQPKILFLIECDTYFVPLIGSTSDC